MGDTTLKLNMSRLQSETRAFLHGRAPKAVDKLARRLALRVASETVRSLNGGEAGYPNPKRIDTGRYRAGWAAGINDAVGYGAITVPASSDPDNPSQSGDGAGSLRKTAAGLVQSVYVENNVEYGVYVEDGTAKMAAGRHLARALLVAAADIRIGLGREIPAAWRKGLR